jgi:periplasmic nitrate reductase NapD
MSTRDLSRRAFLNGGSQYRDRINDAVLHISSAVVSVLPQRRDEVVRLLREIPDLEVHHRNASKIVIVMEAADSGMIGARLAEIAGWPGVLSANMVFEQVEQGDTESER